MQKPLQRLRACMQDHAVDAVFIPSSDFHGSEYAGAHFACRAYFSGFTGSSGTLLVLKDWAGLWTDGRYFLQAEQQLHGSGITLMREGRSETPSLERVLSERLSEGACLAVDGRLLSCKTGRKLQRELARKGISLRTDLDLPGLSWPDRPGLSTQPAWLLDDCYAGETREQKLSRVRSAMKQQGVDDLCISSLEEIAWLLNLRGGDIPNTPVVLSYLVLSAQDAILFVHPETLSPAISFALCQDGIRVFPYDSFYGYVATLSENRCVCLDGRSVNLTFVSSLPSTARILDRPSPIEGMKAIKNETERKNVRMAHRKDGVALTKFLFWLKQKVGLETITERSAADKLESLRREQEDYLFPSFSPIVAYGEHGAIVHYSATEESDVPLRPEGFLLLDTGGHYLQGTTDCTRTIALGPLSDAMRKHYTAVLRGHLNLANAQFLHGCTGANLDYLARAPLWAMQLDYQHGTGHGVGYLLSVHEGPNQIRWRATPGAACFEAGMITSNEPGLYLAGAYGIRLENLLLCVPRGESAYGRFLGFEDLTLVPFDREAIEVSQLTQEECALLNRYHEKVYQHLSPFLTKEENDWLSKQTCPL